MVADQGTLAWYNIQAKGTIKRLGKLDSLTNAQVIDLAKSLTVFGKSTATSPMGETLFKNTTLAGTQLSYYNLGKNNNPSIVVHFGGAYGYTTRVGNTLYDWNNEYASLQPADNEAHRIANIQTIISKFN